MNQNAQRGREIFVEKIDCDLYHCEKKPKRYFELGYLLVIEYHPQKRVGGYPRKVRFAVQTHSEDVKKR